MKACQKYPFLLATASMITNLFLFMPRNIPCHPRWQFLKCLCVQFMKRNIAGNWNTSFMPWECSICLITNPMLIVFITHDTQKGKPAQILHSSSVPRKVFVVGWLSPSWIGMTDANTHHKNTSVSETTNKCLKGEHLWKRLSVRNRWCAYIMRYRGIQVDVLTWWGAYRTKSTCTP